MSIQDARARSDPTPEEAEVLDRRIRERAIESLTGWHYVTMMRGRMPRESHVQWATRVLGREIGFMDECLASEIEKLKAHLRSAEKDGQRDLAEDAK